MIFDISKITIPKEPGIYLMKDSKGEIIYIGKAKNLKKRVSSYFNNCSCSENMGLLQTHPVRQNHDDPQFLILL